MIACVKHFLIPNLEDVKDENVFVSSPMFA